MCRLRSSVQSSAVHTSVHNPSHAHPRFISCPSTVHLMPIHGSSHVHPRFISRRPNPQTRRMRRPPGPTPRSPVCCNAVRVVLQIALEMRCVSRTTRKQLLCPPLRTTGHSPLLFCTPLLQSLAFRTPFLPQSLAFLTLLLLHILPFRTTSLLQRLVFRTPLLQSLPPIFLTSSLGLPTPSLPEKSTGNARVTPV